MTNLEVLARQSSWNPFASKGGVWDWLTGSIAYRGLETPPIPKPPVAPVGNIPTVGPDTLLANSWNTYVQDNVNFFNNQNAANDATTPALASIVSGDILNKILGIPKLPDSRTIVTGVLVLGGVLLVAKYLGNRH